MILSREQGHFELVWQHSYSLNSIGPTDYFPYINISIFIYKKKNKDHIKERQKK